MPTSIFFTSWRYKTDRIGFDYTGQTIYSQSYGFSSSHVGMWDCTCWTMKKAEHRRVNALELWCWRRLFRVPWTAGRSNQLILKEISPEYSLEGLMLKLKLQYFGHLMQRADSLKKTLMLGKIKGRSRRWQQRMRRPDGLVDSMDVSLSKLWEIVKNREAWHAVVHGVAKSRRRLSNWATIEPKNPDERILRREVRHLDTCIHFSSNETGRMIQPLDPKGDCLCHFIPASCLNPSVHSRTQQRFLRTKLVSYVCLS